MLSCWRRIPRPGPSGTSLAPIDRRTAAAPCPTAPAAKTWDGRGAHASLAGTPRAPSPMEITCNRCKTEYEFDDALVSERGTTVRCTNCGEQFKVYRTEKSALPERWVVQRRDGRELVFTNLRDLQRAITNMQVGRHDTLTRGSAPPRPLASIAELEPFFLGRLGATQPGLAAHDQVAGRRREHRTLLPSTAMLLPRPRPSDFPRFARPFRRHARRRGEHLDGKDGDRSVDRTDPSRRVRLHRRFDRKDTCLHPHRAELRSAAERRVPPRSQRILTRRWRIPPRGQPVPTRG